MMNENSVQSTISNQSDFLRNRLSAKYLGVSEVTLWRLSETDPDFPKKIRITKKCCGFLKSELDAFLQLKKSA
jgi:predicted DNA-binding transcriptional regulator AlpA